MRKVDDAGAVCFLDGVGVIETVTISSCWEDEQARFEFKQAVIGAWDRIKGLPSSACYRRIALVQHNGTIKWRTAIMVKDCPVSVPSGIGLWQIFTGRSEPISQHDADHLTNSIPRNKSTPYLVDLAPNVTVPWPTRRNE